MATLEVEFMPGRWYTIINDSVGYCEGYMEACRGQTPRSNMAIKKASKDGTPKIIRTLEASDEPPIGMVAGSPTPKQLVNAALKALKILDHMQSSRYYQNKSGFFEGVDIAKVSAALELLEESV